MLTIRLRFLAALWVRRARFFGAGAHDITELR
jgi:hypothetical protein